jgi:hypothetical protein
MNLSLIPSLFFFFGLLSFVYAAALHYYLRHTDPRVVLHWSLGALVWGVAVTLTVFRTELPLLLSYFLANAIAFSANIELNRALWVMGQDDRSSPVRRHLDPFYFLTYLGLLYAIEWYVPAEWRSVGKTGFVSIVMVVLSLQGARYCFRISGKHALELGRYFAYLYLIVAGLWGSRVAVALVGQGVNAFDPTHLNTAIFLTIFVTGIMKYLMFPMLLLKKSENEKQEQLKKTLAKVNRTVTSGALFLAKPPASGKWPSAVWAPMVLRSRARALRALCRPWWATSTVTVMKICCSTVTPITTWCLVAPTSRRVAAWPCPLAPRAL